MQPLVDIFLPLCAKGCSLLITHLRVYDRHFGRGQTWTRTPCHRPWRASNGRYRISIHRAIKPTMGISGDGGGGRKVSGSPWIWVCIAKLLLDCVIGWRAKFGGVERNCGRMTSPDPPLTAAFRNGPSHGGQVTKQILICTGVLWARNSTLCSGRLAKGKC